MIKITYKIFANMATNAYNSIDNHPFTLEQVLQIFDYYFNSYEEHTSRTHPNIRLNQIKNIIEKMPFMEDMESAYGIELYPEHYPDMIDRYFATKYRHCDYNINHFFSGNIRYIKFYEVCY